MLYTPRQQPLLFTMLGDIEFEPLPVGAVPEVVFEAAVPAVAELAAEQPAPAAEQPAFEAPIWSNFPNPVEFMLAHADDLSLDEMLVCFDDEPWTLESVPSISDSEYQRMHEAHPDVW